jgi:hypothetical protein
LRKAKKAHKIKSSNKSNKKNNSKSKGIMILGDDLDMLRINEDLPFVIKNEED